MVVDGDWSTPQVQADGTYGGFAYGRWMTSWDTKMHNVMTLIGPEVMVTMFTAEYDHVVVVVQQLFGEDPDTGALLWDDSNAYKGKKLDFVDNDGYSVPGQ